MNLTTKCNCCIKEDVCSKKADYQTNVERIRGDVFSEVLEASITCKSFVPQIEKR